MRKLILSALVFFLATGVASAQGSDDLHMKLGGPVPGSMKAQVKWHDDNLASSTPRHGSTTPEMRHASSTPAMKGMQAVGVPGIIASIGANSFTITAPGGKDRATTTLTVNVSSTTIYNKASSTASFSNLAVGSHVVVLGKVSTSTHSVAANRIIITGPGMHDKHEKSDKHEGKKGLNGFMAHLKDLFGKHASSTMSVHASSTSAAAVEGGFLGNFLRTLFGWL